MATEEQRKAYDALENGVIYIGNSLKYVAGSLDAMEESYRQRFGRLPDILGLNLEQRTANLKEAIKIIKEKMKEN